MFTTDPPIRLERVALTHALAAACLHGKLGENTPTVTVIRDRISALEQNSSMGRSASASV